MQNIIEQVEGIGSQQNPTMVCRIARYFCTVKMLLALLQRALVYNNFVTMPLSSIFWDVARDHEIIKLVILKIRQGILAER